MTTEETLLFRYAGAPLLSVEQLAEILHRSKDSLRVSLGGDSDFSRLILPCRVKIGRRIYFRTTDIAKIIDQA